MQTVDRECKEMRKVYRDFLLDKATNDKQVVVLEADLSSSMSTNSLKDKLGNQFINVGIMEAQMIGTAAGLSVLGYKPYIHTFGPFATRRVFDQLFLSLAYSQLSATIVGSDAGVTAEHNGGTHMPFEELALVRAIPNITVYEASDDIQLAAILEETYQKGGLNYIRTIRKQPVPIYSKIDKFEEGYKVVREGKDVQILASGIMVEEAINTAKILSNMDISASVIDVYRIKPINSGLIDRLENQAIVVAENHNVIGGLGSAICEMMARNPHRGIEQIGIVEQFGQVGKQAYLKEYYHLTAQDIVKKVQELV